MEFHSGKYGEGAKSHELKKLGLEKSPTLSSKENKELASYRKKKDMAKKMSKIHGEKQHSIKERMELNYPKGFPHH